MALDRPGLFDCAPLRAFALAAEDVAELQSFFAANAEYFLRVDGRLPRPEAARDVFSGQPPAGWPFTRKWLIGFANESGSLVAMADVVQDLLAKNVWHIGLFIVATALHGGGTAQALYGRLEAWAHDQGARWMRLGVVEGYTKAQRFWEGLGYAEVRRRGGVAMGDRVNTVIVMVKPLAGGSIADYLALVARDTPEHG